MTAAKTRALLTAAHDKLLERPLSHTTGAFARDMNSNPVAATSPYSVCWCTRGLFLHIRGVDSLDHPDVFPATQLVLLAALEFGYRSTSACNDSLGRTGAIRMLARAIELLDTEPFDDLLTRAETAQPDLQPALAGEETNA